MMGAIVLLAIYAALSPAGPLPEIANPSRPPITEQEQGNPDKAADAKNSPAHPLYVTAQCKHGCGYSEDDKGWWQKFWTDPTATFTGLLFISTALLWLVTERTLWHASKDSARQAREAEDQLRPYVYVSDAWFHTRLETGTRVVCFIRNGGKTPATYFEVSFRSDAITKGNRPDFKSFPSKAIWPVLGPGDTERTELTDDQFTVHARKAYVADEPTKFYISGEIFYGDIWGNKYRTQFCYVVRDSSLTVNNLEVRTNGRKMSRPAGNLISFEIVEHAAKQ